MTSFPHTIKRFGAVELITGGYIDAHNNKIKNVQYPTANGDAASKEYVDQLNSDVGDIKMSVKNADFRGWLKCDGRSLSRTTYAALFAVIGTAFGSVNGTSFNLPDCRGRVLGTVGQGIGLTNRTLGTSIGEENHILTSTEMPSHSHTSNAVGGTVGLITATGANTASSGLDNSAGEPNLYASPVALTINSTGGGAAHNVMQPTIFIANVYIYGGVVA